MPLQDYDLINKRLDIVELLVGNVYLRTKVQDDFLKKIPDIDKLQSKFYKVFAGKKHGAGLIDCVKVYTLVNNLKKNTELLESVQVS
jgi:DNA mismatch repair protein MSH2